MGITDPFIPDNYYVWFKNDCPLDGPLYDDARFEPLFRERDGKYFLVSLDSPHERFKWALVTERYGFNAPEFDCRDIREMVKYINSISLELQQGFIPPFIAEKDAVTASCANLNRRLSEMMIYLTISKNKIFDECSRKIYEIMI